MIISVSGKMGSGKDLVGKIIQYLYWRNYNSNKHKAFPSISEEHFDAYCNSLVITDSIWEIHKWADALKDIICILTGCTREQLEDRDFKESKLSDEWIRYGYADGFIKQYIGNGEMGGAIMNNKQCSKEEYEEHYKTNWQTAYKTHLTYRELLQVLGTDLFRNKLHNDTWVNSLMSKYKQEIIGYDRDSIIGKYPIYGEYPNWIITDTRFPNEVKAVKDKGGINILIKRTETDLRTANQHESETALDYYEFDYVIYNNGSIEDLIQSVHTILKTEVLL